jgi:hypothetical protein
MAVGNTAPPQQRRTLDQTQILRQHRWAFLALFRGSHQSGAESAESLVIPGRPDIHPAAPQNPGAANRYDPAWERYFEERLGVKMAEELKGQPRLLHLWKAQDGLCPICNQKITFLTGWHNQHIVWRSQGGSDRTENRVWLHPNCHRQVHSHGLSVVKPRPEKGV